MCTPYSIIPHGVEVLPKLPAVSTVVMWYYEGKDPSIAKQQGTFRGPYRMYSRVSQEFFQTMATPKFSAFGYLKMEFTEKN